MTEHHAFTYDATVEKDVLSVDIDGNHPAFPISESTRLATSIRGSNMERVIEDFVEKIAQKKILMYENKKREELFTTSGSIDIYISNPDDDVQPTSRKNR